MKEKHTPDWLQEILDHGFSPKEIHDDFKESFFGHIEADSDAIVKMPKAKMYVLEGLPGAGKTTMLHEFAKNKNIATVPQILPFEPHAGQTVGHDFYQRSDLLKTDRWRKTKHSHLVLDRYYLSTLAFTWAYDKMHDTASYPSMFRWYKEALSNHLLIRPYKVFYIEVPLRLSLIRKERKPDLGSGDIWSNSEFLENFDRYYHYFYKEVEPGTKVVKLSGELPFDDLYETVKQEIVSGK